MSYKELINLKSVNIKGDYKTKTVWINGRELKPESSLEIYTHSSKGFNWGDSGNGSAQLALAILYDITSNKKLSMILHHVFKIDFLSELRKSDFEIKIDIGKWFDKKISANSLYLD